LQATDLTSAAFRAAMGHFPTGVALVTAGPPESVEVMTANSFISVSLVPLLVLVSLGESGRMRGRLEHARGFAVHVLGEGQRQTAALFARRDRPNAAAAAHLLGATPTTGGNVLVPGTLACFECVPFASHPAGDHVLYVGRVVAVHVGADGAPLAFHRGAYRELATPPPSAPESPATKGSAAEWRG